ncbi:MAG TPA: PIG-L family deacetylase [Thermomicrobiales bacterium]|nr:PIG-L family deacetylase [Thermomicrobiales bacterium]
MQPLLAVFAHPDDETFGAAGVMAAATERGVPVTVISATRGEAGESAIAGLDDPERLGVVRERELREAMRQIGVSDVRLLGYRDSGMAGSPTAEDPRAFIRAPVQIVAAQLGLEIQSLRPQAILTFGPEGLYGHPDHLHIHHVALRAIQIAADPSHTDGPACEPWQTPALYFAAFPREDMLAVLDRPNSPLRSLSAEARANVGTPRSQITHKINIRPWAERKHAAIESHRTQTAEGGPLSGIPPEVREWQLADEYFVRVPLPWSTPENSVTSDIIAELAAEQNLG